MQGYFEYELFGSKKDLNSAIDKIEELAQENTDIKFLLEFKYDKIETSNTNNGKYSLKFGMSESGNINAVPFLFDDMMGDLCKIFFHLEILGTGYFLGSMLYPIWHSKVGSEFYDEDYEPISIFEQ